MCVVRGGYSGEGCRFLLCSVLYNMYLPLVLQINKRFRVFTRILEQSRK